MPGEEIIAAGKAAKVVGKKALAEDDKTKDVLLRVAETMPEMTAAARSMAARVAVKERVKLKLYEPFARMLGVSKTYFEDTFPQEMGAKIADIPDENLITPLASIAVPALQGLSYTFEELNLKELYLNLLATASDSRRSHQAHPAFAEIIKQLTPDESKVLYAILEKGSISVARISKRRNIPSGILFGTVAIAIAYLLPLANSNGESIVEPQILTWMDNWQRLGLLDVSFDKRKPGRDAYSWVRSRPEYAALRRDLHFADLRVDKGIAIITDFGYQFFRAVQQGDTAT